MKKSVSSYIVDNGARLSKIYDLAEEYAMEYLHEPELSYLARRRNKIMDDIGEMATEILILRQKLYEAQLDKIIAPISKECKKDTIDSLQYLRKRLIDERGSDFSGVRALDVAIYCVCVINMEGRS